MRIVTRADFDSVACAVILYEALDIKTPVKWVEPGDMQKGLVDVKKGDIIANLPYDENCSLWFDHHYTNRISAPFEGSFIIAPSAARVIYDYYKDHLKKDFNEFIRQADKIDSANLDLDEVDHPEKYPYVLISMTISSRNKSDEPYWNRLIDLFRQYEINDIIDDPEIKSRCNAVIKQNELFKKHLLEHTHLIKHVAVTDFRSFEKAPDGNRFLPYSLFPDATVSIKIRFDNEDRKKVIVSVGHSIFNENCTVNAGLMLSQFEGGGHKGAGACSFHVSKAEKYIPQIIDILVQNKNNEP